MKVSTKLSGAFALLVLIVASLLVYHVRTIRHAVLANYELAEISSRLYLSMTRQIGWINELEENAGKFWVTRDEGYLARFGSASDSFEAGLEALRTTAFSVEETEEIERLEARWAEFEPLASSIERGAAPAEPPLAELRDRLFALRLQTRRVSDASQTAMHARLEASARAARRAERVSWLAAGGTLLLSVLVFTLIVRSISSALRRLQEGTHEVARGNFGYRLATDRNDEFSQLARDFNVMTRRLDELDRVKRDFLSKVSHDLKTPLASMRETVQVMLDGVPGPVTAKQRRLLDLTDQSARRLSGMIAKLLDLSAMQAGALMLEIRPQEVRSVVQPAIETLALGDPQRSGRIVAELPDEPLLVECDADRIVQVLVNLLENAVKFSSDGAPVRVSAVLVGGPTDGLSAARWRAAGDATRGGPALLLEVSDRGTGVPDEEKARIFEQFFQSGNGGRMHGQGVGLGLAICREIVELHGGAVWVRDNPGGGSIFSVLLPRAGRAPAPAAALPAAPLQEPAVGS